MTKIKGLTWNIYDANNIIHVPREAFYFGHIKSVIFVTTFITDEDFYINTYIYVRIYYLNSISILKCK